MPRQAGVLAPLFSLRSATDWGVGEIPDLVPFARWASSAGFGVVQLLPVNEASRGQNSPYGALTAFGIDPVYVAIDPLEDFAEAGGHDALSPEDRRLLALVRASPTVRWDEVRALKWRALELAFASFTHREWRRKTQRARELERFAREQSAWLDDYALFVALHDDLMEGKSWTDWPAPLRDREPRALADARTRLSDRVLFRTWLQWVADRQWHAARRGAGAVGVELAGDIPFMVAPDSADVWARRHDFRLDARVGVPPDAFSATGQDWGLPVYRWAEMEAAGHQWMTARASRMADMYGLYRVDHVVGLYRTYFFPADGGKPAFVPSEEPAQIANGEGILALFSRRARVIAEDLGVIPPFVRASLDRLEIPGYRVQRWERDWDEPGQPYRDPAAWPAVSVATTGTHDTDSVAEWYEGLTAEERLALLSLPGLVALRERAPERYDVAVRDAFLETLYGAGSDLLLMPFQDVMGHRQRVNVPGTVTAQNWTYRLPTTLQQLAADSGARVRLRSLAERHGRAAPPALRSERLPGPVYLVRHARAEAGGAAGDAARRLTAEGRAAFTGRLAPLARRLRVDRVVTSPLRRAVETAELLAEATGAPVEEEPALASGASTGKQLLALARRLGPGTALVGHNPELGEAIALAAGREVEVPPGTIAAVSPGGKLKWVVAG